MKLNEVFDLNIRVFSFGLCGVYLQLPTWKKKKKSFMPNLLVFGFDSFIGEFSVRPLLKELLLA